MSAITITGSNVDNGNWKEGKISCGSVIYDYQAKVFEEPSGFGIDTPKYPDGGTVSKLWITLDGETIVNYDRGWDIKPDEDTEEWRVVMAVCRFFE